MIENDVEDDTSSSGGEIPVSEWLTCFCVVKFDIEIGQTLEYTYPPMQFTDEEITNICFMSFPDSNSSTGDTMYSFRTKYGGITDSFLHGYVFFRQEKDPTVARGYVQRSVVLMSPHPYVGLFKKVMSVVGPIFFECGQTLLEAAYQNVAAWPYPTPGRTFELPIMGSTLTYHVPFSSSTPHIIDPSTRVLAFTPRDQVVSNLQSVNIYSVFRAITSKLWLLWELVLTGEPILLVSPTPSQCSDAVIALVSLISPLRYCGDYRPYFTIHDSDFKNFTQPSSPDTIPSLILGVTNPFFLKVLSHWPHLITVGSHNQPNNPRPSTPPKMPGVQRDRVSKHVTDYKEGIQTSHKAHVEKDEKIIKQLVNPSSSSSSSSPSSSSPVLAAAVNNELLRRHFLRLTESFLVPLERYFTSLMPLAKNISLFTRPPRLKPFNKSEFLDILSSLDKQYVVQSKSKELELYKRFLSSVNFHGWFGERKQAALQQLNLIYRKLLLEADIAALAKGRSNVEIVDLYMRLREQLIGEENRPETEESNVMCARLRQHLQALTTYLPSPPAHPSPPPTTGIAIVTK
jgi:hypothetical protein